MKTEQRDGVVVKETRTVLQLLMLDGNGEISGLSYEFFTEEAFNRWKPVFEAAQRFIDERYGKVP